MKILTIDDNEDIVGLCEMLLTDEGHDFTGIDNGREGLQTIRDEKFDVVLLDLSMPDFSGIDVVDALVDEGIISKQKVVIFSASSATESEFEQLLEKGAHSILKKPINTEELLKRISDLAAE